MPINESIIAVPINVENPGQTRQFLLRLVEKLDIVLGYRGDDPYVSSSDLASVTATNSASLTALEQSVLNVIETLISENSTVITSLLDTATDSLTEQINALKSSSTVTNADESQPTLTTPPTQLELQAMQDQIAFNGDKLNDLLTILRNTGIIGT